MRGFRNIVGTILAAAFLIAGLAQIINPTRTHAQLASVQTWAGSAGGTANAPTITVHNVIALNDLLGVPIRFIPTNTNTGPATITINLDTGGALGPIAIQRPTSNLGLQPVAGAEIETNQMLEITYDGTTFEITSPINMTAIGASVEVRGTVAPAGTLIEDGSCISTSTYSSLFAILGTNYNALAPVACGAGTFALPYSNGTMFAAQDNQGAHTASRINSAGSGCNATGVVLCGGQNQTLVPGQIPTIAVVSNQTTILTGSIFSNSENFATGGGNFFTALTQNTVAQNTITSTSSNTGGLAHPILNPVLVGLRAIKY